jgi:GWxTD domain-containing protein
MVEWRVILIKKTWSIPLFLMALALSASSADKPNLPERYQKWLDEEAVYIITSVEKDVFLKLRTDRERDLFIEAFWNHRDPTPDSPTNEFKTEHFRRIAYATQQFGREGASPGWKTDRGRMYILLGESLEIQRYAGKSGIYDCESWFYQGKTDLGLPSAFNLLFFKEHGQGMYKLYSPVRNGPQALLAGHISAPGDFEGAYNAIYDIDASLAMIAINLVPGESSEGLGRPSMASDILIQRIETLPSRAVQERYARKFLEYKDIVDVEYSANYLDSASLIKVFREQTGLYFVHYAIEPQRLSVRQYERKTYTTLKVNGRVTTPDGRLVYQYDKTVSIDMPDAQMAELARAPFNLHDVFPLIPGDYQLSVLVKNEVSKEFWSVEQSLRIPQSWSGVQMTQPLLGYKVSRQDLAPRKIRAFQVGPYQIFCQPGRIFTSQDTLAVAFQLNELSPDLARSGLVKLVFLKDGQAFREITRKPFEFPDLPNALEEIPLADFPPAHYQVRVSFLNGSAEVVTASEEFDLTFAPSVGRPWYSSRVLPEPGDAVYSQITGTQFLNLGRYDEARASLEQAFQQKPDSPETAFNLARVYLVRAEYSKAIQVLTPFLGRAQGIKYEMYMLAGDVFRKSGEFAKAVEVLNMAVSHYGVNASVLNAIGESNLGLGRLAEALAAFEKSLQLSPDQPEIRKKIEELKKNK